MHVEFQNKKSLIIYFSRADENYFGGQMKFIQKGNTEVIAEFIKDFIGADIFKVERKVPYSGDYKTCIEESKKENDNGEKPELARYLENIDKYDIVYIGGPIYWGVLPAPMITQLERFDWHGKVIRPFVTHEGSRMGNVMSQLKEVCKGADIKDGIAIEGSRVNEARKEIEAWI